MYKLIILLEPPNDWMAFEQSWPDFLEHCEKMPGLLRATTSRVEDMMYGNYPCAIIHELYFKSREALIDAMASSAGHKAGEMLQAMSGGKVTLFFASHMEEDIENLQRYRQAKNTLGMDDLQTFLNKNNVDGELLLLDIPTPTVKAASEAVGVEAGQIVKSVLFTVSGEPVLAIACGDDRIEQQAIAAHFGVGRKKVKLADPESVLQISGYSVGAMPPFGHLQPLQTILDPRVLKQPIVYAGGGAENALLRLKSTEIERLTRPRVVDLIRVPDSSS
ncbi:MAG: YbaK/EbsC family protein [Chloroflexota bacterium]